MTTTQDAPTTGLIVVPDVPPAELFTGDRIDELIKEVRACVKDAPTDATTERGRKEIASLAYKVSTSKTLVQKIGDELVAPHNKELKRINPIRKKWKEELDIIRQEVRRPLDEWEYQEAQKRAELDRDLRMLRDLRDNTDALDVAGLEDRLAKAESTYNRNWLDLKDHAADAYEATVSALRQRIEARKEYEATQAELAELRKKEAERERVEHEQRIADDAARAEREKQEAKAAHEARAKAAREADEKHRRAIEASILRAFIDAGMEQAHAAQATFAIVDNKIPHVTINY